MPKSCRALRGIDLEIFENEMLAIMGSSGSGKSTILNILGLLDVPTAGQYWLDGQDVAKLSQSALARVRGRRIGFVFQTFELLPRQSAIRNVELPLIYSGATPRRALAVEALRRSRIGGSHEAPPEPDVGRPTTASGHSAGLGAAARHTVGR